MKAIGYVRVSTDRQAEQGVSLEAQEAKIRAMATVQGAELLDVIVDGGESAKSLNRPGLQRLLDLINAGKVESVIVAKLDRLTRSVKDLCGLLELFERRKVALVSVAESLDTGSAAGRLVITIMAAVSQWEREAIGERSRDALRHKRGKGERVGNIEFGYRLSSDKVHVEPDPAEQAALAAFADCDWAAIACARLPALSTKVATGPDVALNGGSNQWCVRSARTLRTGGREWHNTLAVISPAYAQLVGIPFSGLGVIRPSGERKGCDILISKGGTRRQTPY